MPQGEEQVGVCKGRMAKEGTVQNDPAAFPPTMRKPASLTTPQKGWKGEALHCWGFRMETSPLPLPLPSLAPLGKKQEGDVGGRARARLPRGAGGDAVAWGGKSTALLSQH